MTKDEAKSKQDWLGMYGHTAFHLIERHAENWNEIELMMDAWLQTNIESALKIEREACAAICELEATEWRKPKYSYAASVGEHCAAKIRMRSNAEITGRASGPG